MTVGCSTINVQIPATITATAITATPSEPCLEGTCTVDVSVDWMNTGDVPGDFTPNISVDGFPAEPIFGSETLGAGSTTTHTFVVYGLTKTGSPHYICPIPNEPYII